MPSNSSKANKLPERWNEYTDMGNVVAGTRFLPFKTPLKEQICERKLASSDWFTPATVLERAPRIKFVIDLTQTDRFYSKEEFLQYGVHHKKIYCRGGGKQLPPHHIIHEFTRAVDGFLQSKECSDGDALIGVHCTHGLNRTGYLICKYMVMRFGVPAQEAIEAFENARGHKIERDVYVRDILRTSVPQYPPRQAFPQNPRYEMVRDRSSHRPSPLEGCYSEPRRSYSNRNVFYPNF